MSGNNIHLGNNVYFSVKVWQGKPKVHIRYYKHLTDTYGNTTLTPTRSGICLNPEQFDIMFNHINTMRFELLRHIETVQMCSTRPNLLDLTPQNDYTRNVPVISTQPNLSDSMPQIDYTTPLMSIENSPIFYGESYNPTQTVEPVVKKNKKQKS